MTKSIATPVRKFVEADMDGKCPICEEQLIFGTDEWGSA